MTDISHLPQPLRHNWEWQFSASCRDSDPQIFFHPPGERDPDHQARDQAAKQICLRCPVRDPCLRFALEAREPYGVWGGMTERERRARANPRARSVHHALPAPVEDSAVLLSVAEHG